MKAYKFNFTFHNVGQGLFYTGNIKTEPNDFNFAYDCGSESLGEIQLNQRINDYKSTLKSKQLDLLIISHFHADHINGLERLLKDITVGTVVLPYLSPVESFLYLTSNRKEKPWYYDFLSDPVNYLIERGVSKIILIEDGTNYEKEEEDFKSPEEPSPSSRESLVDYNTLGDSEADEEFKKRLLEEREEYEDLINKNKLIPKTHYGYIGILSIWYMRFFNFRKPIVKTKIANFENCLKTTFGVSNIKDIDLSSKSIINEITKIRSNKFRTCYDTAFGKTHINLTSLVVYHAPMQIVNRLYEVVESKPLFHANYLQPHIYRHYMHGNTTSLGQFLTGDAELKQKRILKEFQKHYNQVFDKVFLFQLAHHGSKKNWHHDLLYLLKNCNLWIASAGINSKYNHPSWSVIHDILNTHRFPIIVNENNSLKSSGHL
jgi:hypothetical protein